MRCSVCDKKILTMEVAYFVDDKHYCKSCYNEKFRN